jgi:dUTP pyrophosphatase
MNLKIDLQLMEKAVAPQYQSAGAAGMDLCSTESFELKPLERHSVSTGIKISLPEGYEAQVRPRSGLALKHGISMVNSPGTIDSDYRGEIRVILINLGQEVVKFEGGDRVAQLVIAPVTRAEWQIVESLDETDRGTRGFGSSGGFGLNGV